MAEAAARRGVAGALLLIAVAMAVPKVFGWHVHALHIAPLVASWRPRIGPGTLPAIALGAAAVWWGPRLAAALSWPRLAAVAYAAGVAWQVSLATVDGWGGIGHILNHHDEYLPTARGVTDISAALHDWIDRIPLHSAHHWPVHVAGHPPGALLFFVLLDRIGLGSGLAAGWVVMLIAATTPVAVLLTLRRLGAADAARNVAPLLVIGPAAIWTAVSADAVFAAVGAWALCCLAYSATSLTRIGTIAAGLGAGLLLGYCVLLSYGLPILGLLALGVLVVARTARPLPWLIAGTAAVMLAFAAAGFAWWDALPVLRRRYYAGIAARRPAAYWVWGDLAALCISAGPAVGASVAVVLTRLRQRIEPVVALALAALSCIVVADLSFMSKAEVERIWLPFVPWLLLGLALLPATWRRYAFAGQVVFALLVQSLFGTHW